MVKVEEQIHPEYSVIKRNYDILYTKLISI